MCGLPLRHAHDAMLQKDCSCLVPPFLLRILAVRENAAEACATQCHSEVDRLITPIDEQETTQERHKHQEAYDLCYSKCVASETEQVAREREQVRPVMLCSRAAGLLAVTSNMWLIWKICCAVQEE